MPLAFSQSAGKPQERDYNGGNGTVLSRETTGNIEVVVRKHSDKFRIGSSIDWASDSEKTVFVEPNENSKVLCILKENDEIVVSQVRMARNLATGEEATFCKLTVNGKEGWKKIGNAYSGDKWEYVETINSSGKTWTVRKLSCGGSARGNINIRDKPGTVGTKKIGLVSSGDRVSVFCVTEERESIAPSKYAFRWAKINYKGTEGWIFGEFIDVERGGFWDDKNPEWQVYADICPWDGL